MTYGIDLSVSLTPVFGRAQTDLGVDFQDSWAPTGCIALGKGNLLEEVLAYHDDKKNQQFIGTEQPVY